MDSIVFHCPKCNRSLQIDAVHSGAQVACPQCGEHMTVPMVAAGQPAVAGASERPTSITVFGVLNIVFGGLGLMCVPLNMYSLEKAAGAASELAMIPRNWQVISAVVSPFTALWLIVTGIGLLHLKRWARGWAIAYGFFSIVFGLVGIGMLISAAIPNIQSLSEGSTPERIGYVVGSSVGGVFGTLAAMVYPVLLIIFMCKAKAKESCVR